MDHVGSIWTETADFPQFETLKQDMKTDVLIVGGGIAGLLCAYMLEQTGVSYILVEAKRICSGITKDTTAKITSQHGLIYDRLIREFGLEKKKALGKLSKGMQSMVTIVTALASKAPFTFLDEPVAWKLHAAGRLDIDTTGLVLLVAGGGTDAGTGEALPHPAEAGDPGG